MQRRRRAVFLDRDGTLIVERDWVRRPSDVRLVAGAGVAVRALNEAGYVVCVLTNQSGVARGYFTEDDVEQIHADLRRRLARFGATIDAVYHCPHHPEGRIRRYRKRCACRKPRKGLLQRAVRELDLTLSGSFIVGDDLRDLELSRGSPLSPVLVRTGKGKSREAEARRLFGRKLTVTDRLVSAVDHILKR